MKASNCTINAEKTKKYSCYTEEKHGKVIEVTRKSDVIVR